MTIIQRLRNPPLGTETSERNLMAQAAAEIERLREACADALQELETMRYARYESLERKLRAALDGQPRA